MKTLDITDFKERGKDLALAINNAVGDTQRVLIQELPSELLMTREQFDDQNPDMEMMYQSDLFIYQTKHNVMEVRVKDA